jgi:hypothetical protein
MKRFLLWDYPRAVWQYDLMVGLILAFIFLTPRDVFKDQPRASNVVMLPAESGTNVYWIEPELLTATAETARPEQASEILKRRKFKFGSLVRLEPIFDSEDEIKGYMAYTKP